MASITTQDLLLEELEYSTLVELLQELQDGLVRKPDHFNYMHFLLLLLYDSYGCTRDNRYPLWRWYHRIKKKLITSKLKRIDSEKVRQRILDVMQNVIDTTPTIATLLEESVQLEEQYVFSYIYDLFKSYTCLHTYLYMEQIDKPVVNENQNLFNLFKSSIKKLYRYEYCDLIHFAIVHKKVSLLNEIFKNNDNWLDISINLVTERGWLPLHYAAFVGDTETVKTICNILSSSAFVFDALSFVVPSRQQRDFEKNPSEYILKACGVEHDTTTARQRKRALSLAKPSLSSDSHSRPLSLQDYQQRLRSNINEQTGKDQPSLTTNVASHDNNTNNNILSTANDNDIPDADELELSSLPLMQREEYIDKLIYGTDNKHMLIPSPLTLASIAICGEKADYEEIVKILLDSHLMEYDGINHECLLNRVLDHMHTKNYATFQHVQVYRDTETEGPSAFVYYQFDGFMVNADARPVSDMHSSSSVTLNTSKNDESVASDDGQQSDTPIRMRCFLTVLVLRDVFIQYPRWDFHLLRENIEENFVELENALDCRPTILYPDGKVISYRKRSDITWEVKVKYHLSTETSQSLYIEVDYYFFESFGSPFADAFTNTYQTPFYIACMTDSTVMMHIIFDSFFKRRNVCLWGTAAERHLEHCFDGILQIKNNSTTFLTLCTTLSSYYQVEGDPFIEENSATIQRIFVHAFACCVRRNAKIELDYLIKNHALIYYDSCRTKPSDIRHNVLTYCVIRNLASVFDQLMTNMKTMMYKTYQNSTNPDWQPHIAWREIIHVIIDPFSQQQQQQQTNSTHEQVYLAQLACYGDTTTSHLSIGSIPTLHATGDEYTRCINSRKNLLLKLKRKLPRTLNDTNKHQPLSQRMFSPNPQQLEAALNQFSASNSTASNLNNVGVSSNNPTTIRTTGTSLGKKSQSFLKSVNRLRLKTYERSNSMSTNNQLTSDSDKGSNTPIETIRLNELNISKDTISLVSNTAF